MNTFTLQYIYFPEKKKKKDQGKITNFTPTVTE